MILACKSKKIGASVTFSMSAICARVSFRRKLSCARHARLRKFWRKSLKLLKLLTWGSSKPLKLLKFIARLKSSKVFKVKLLPETLLPDYDRARTAQHAVRARRPRRRTMQTAARRLHTAANAQRTRRTRLLVDASALESSTARSPRAGPQTDCAPQPAAAIAGHRRATDGPRASVALSSRAATQARRALAVQCGVGQVLGSGGAPLGHATRAAGRNPDASSRPDVQSCPMT